MEHLSSEQATEKAQAAITNAKTLTDLEKCSRDIRIMVENKDISNEQRKTLGVVYLFQRDLLKAGESGEASE
jgi:hypothetical protein